MQPNTPLACKRMSWDSRHVTISLVLAKTMGVRTHGQTTASIATKNDGEQKKAGEYGKPEHHAL